MKSFADLKLSFHGKNKKQKNDQQRKAVLYVAK